MACACTATRARTPQARLHRFNFFAGKKGEDAIGPPVFRDTSKTPKELMKAFGAANFLRSAWILLAQPDPTNKHRVVNDALQARVAIMVKYANRALAAAGVPQP